MSNVQNWSQHFNIPAEKLAEFQKNLKSHETVLQKCFEQNLINENDYLVWAKKHFNIPTLKPSFFDQPKPEALIQKYIKQLPPVTLPVVEQDGTLYIACLEPVKTFKFSQPVQWLLAPYSVMMKWLPHEMQTPEPMHLPLEIESFDDLKKSTPAPVTPPPVIPKPNVIAMPPPAPPKAIELPPPPKVEEPLKIEITPPPVPAPETVVTQVEAPKGMEIDFSKMELEKTKIAPAPVASDNPYQINVEGLQIEEFSEVSAISPVMDTTEAPPGVEPYQAIEPTEEKLKVDLTVMAVMPTEAPIPTEPPPPPTPEVAPPPPTPEVAPPTKLKLTPPSSLSPKIEPVTPVVTTSPKSIEPPAPPVESNTKSEINFSGIAPVKPTIPTSIPTPSKFWDTAPVPSTGIPNLEAKLVQSESKAQPPPPPTDEISEIDHGEIAQQTLNKDAPDMAFSQMKSFFDQSMILLFENQKLKPWKHDSTWSQESSATDTIDLSTPSIFRIVAETRKSYHGHVIPNTINDSFFNSWNKGVYPEHITMCPLLLKNTLVGMLLGGTSKERARSVKLETIERIANQLAQDLQISKKVA